MPEPETLTVAVQGELGSNSHVAARAFFAPETPSIVPCRSFGDLFAAVRNGTARFGMVPVDNSLAGSIHDVWDLLNTEPLPISGELFLRIRHCLIARPGVELGGIRRVFSHPQALAQCRRFLTSLEGVESIEEYDTAGAVKLIAASQQDGDGAIAPAEAAASHGMSIIAEDIQDCHDNFTRFLVAGAESATPEGADHLKTSLLIRLGDGARQLTVILSLLAASSLEVLRVESRKLSGQPWEYLCYIDLRGLVSGDLLARLRAESIDLSLVGPYAEGQRVEPGSAPADR